MADIRVMREDLRPPATPPRRHFISIKDITRDDVERLLATARTFERSLEREVKKLPTLKGRLVINVFYESSTRTSSSFELAAKRLSADTMSIKSSGSSVDKGESLKDTAITLGAYDPDVIVIRHPQIGAPQLVARVTEAHVVNAGDGKHQHPTQALLDLYTMREALGRLEGLHVAIVGDVLHSRVARSLIQALGLVGAHVTLVGQRVAAHLRDDTPGRHTTNPAHMPKAHQHHLEWTPSRLIQWAETIGPQTAALVSAILADRPHPEQGYRSCLGLLRLSRRDGAG